MIPFLAVGAAASAASILDNVLGRPFELWSASVNAQNQAQIRQPAYRGNFDLPNVLPSPDALLSAWRRGLISDVVAAEALLATGVSPPGGYDRYSTNDGAPPNLPARTWRWYKNLWRNIGLLSQSRPDVGGIVQLNTRRRLSATDYDHLTAHLDASFRRYRAVAEAQYNAPEIGTLWQLYRLGRISEDEFKRWSARVGWFNQDALDLAAIAAPLPSLQELILAFHRTNMSQEDWTRYSSALGHVDPELLRLQLVANRPMPGAGDLVTFAVREVWDPAIVQRWGYDQEFPAPFAYWMKWQGMDWGEPFTDAQGRRHPAVSWPLAYWRAHWRPMPLEHAYRAYGRFRGNRIARYLDRYPNLREFTFQHLNDVIKVADYPAPVRDWLGALATPILPIMSVRIAYRYGVRNRQWAREQLLDRNYVADDVESALDVIDEQKRRQDNAAVESYQRRLPGLTIREILAGYRDGMVTRDNAHARLSALGLEAGAVVQAVGLVDLEEDRQTLRQVVASVKKGYLNGSFSYQETVANLRNLNLTGNVVDRLVRRWFLLHTVERRTLATTQLTSLVAQGAIAPALALVRLRNLGWTEPDAALLLGQAGARLLQQEARAAQQQVRAAQSQHRALLAAQRTAAQALRRAQLELRSITPESTLRRWYLKGIRKGQWIRDRLVAIGKDRSTADTLLSEWAGDYAAMHDGEPAAVANLGALYRRQTSLSTVKKWFQLGIVSEPWTRERLRLMELMPQTIEGHIREWIITRKQPKPPATRNAPAPPAGPEPAGPAPAP